MVASVNNKDLTLLLDDERHEVFSYNFPKATAIVISGLTSEDIDKVITQLQTLKNNTKES
ncbi:MAG: hypothetical protein WC479_10040 [Candidatus Izemoplasmatales bacterium]